MINVAKRPPPTVVGLNAVEGQKGKIVPVKSMGRPKGSRNQVNLYKMLAEETVRSQNATKVLEVCSLIVDQALQGDKASQKLVWQSVVSNGTADERAGVEKVEIKIGTMAPPKEVIIDSNDIEDVDDE